MIRVLVFTCDKYTWALRGFAYQFNKYWSGLQPVVVCGYTPPAFSLPDNFEFFQIDKNEYPSTRWTNGLIKALKVINDDHVVIMLEDYWLCRGVNHQAVNTLHDLAQQYDNILRIDLTDDRQYNGRMREFDYLPYWGYNDILWTPPDSEYQSSLQAGIWNRKRLLEVVQPNESAWQFEIAGTGTVIRSRSDLWVLGTRQKPIRYANIFRGGDSSPASVNLSFLINEDVAELRKIGALK